MKITAHKTNGFSLVEILGAVAIIITLASISVSSINGAMTAAREGAYKRQIQMLNSSYQNYIACGGNIPNMYSNDRTVKKAQAKPATELLLVELPTPYGNVGPFLPQTPTDTWYVGANMGGQIAGVTKYIGFDSALGFQDLGAD